MAGKNKKYNNYGVNSAANKKTGALAGGFAAKTDVEAAGEAGTPITQTGTAQKANKKNAGVMTKTDSQG